MPKTGGSNRPGGIDFTQILQTIENIPDLTPKLLEKFLTWQLLSNENAVNTNIPKILADRIFPQASTQVSAQTSLPLDWSWAAPKQLEIRDKAAAGHILVYGDRQRTGKTTTLFCTWVQMNAESPRPMNLNYINTSRDKSEDMLEKLLNDVMLQGKGFVERVVDHSSRYAKLWNGAVFEVKPAKAAAAKGPSIDIIWIDDLEAVLKEHKDVVAASSGQTLVRPDAHIWYSSNQASGEFQNLKNVIHDKLTEDQFSILTITHEEVPQTNYAEQGSVVEAIMEGTMGKDYVMSQLYNLEVNTEGEWFSQEMLDITFAPMQKPEKFSKMCIGIDEGFEPDPMALECIGALGNKPDQYQIFELDGWSQNKLTPSQKIEKIKDTHNFISTKYYGNRKVPIYIESNSGGKALAEELRQNGLVVVTSNFVKDLPENPQKNPKNFSVPYRAIIAILMQFMDGNQIHLFTKTLDGEMRRFNDDGTFDHSFHGLLHAFHAIIRPTNQENIKWA